jgi:RNA recognition motif-containing protein
MMTIYLGNLPDAATEADVAALCAPFGEVLKVSLIRDHQTGAFRGFGYVEMSAADAARAVAELDGVPYEGRTLRANEARDRGAKPPRRSW